MQINVPLFIHIKGIQKTTHFVCPNALYQILASVQLGAIQISPIPADIRESEVVGNLQSLMDEQTKNS